MNKALAAGVLIGRRAELDALLQRLDEGRAGAGGVVVVAGEAGAGKTRLVEELARHAEGLGVGVRWGHCHDADWWPPYGPWLEVSGPVAEAEGGRFALYDAVLERLREASLEQPLLLVIDDVHCCDPASLELLQYAARFLVGMPVLIVVTVRDGELELTHPVLACLSDLQRERLCARVVVAPLAEEETAELLAALCGATPAPAVASYVHGQTGGNPFFVEQIVRNFGADLVDDLAGALEIPATVRQAVGGRVARLAPETAQLLSDAAAFPGRFAFSVLRALTSHTEDVLLECLDEACRAGLLRTRGEGEEYEFANAVVRQTFYDDLSPSRKARLHRRVVAALERTYAGREHEVAGELALHYRRSASLPGAAHGIPYALAAAERCAGGQRTDFLTIARELSAEAEPLEQARLAAELDAAGTAAAPDGLTRREVEVLRLVSSGRSNKEIAAELVVSLHTVERHLANIYGKIGTRNRAGATAYAAHHDLLAPSTQP